MPILTLTDEQEDALKTVEDGNHVFITGAGGVGKSTIVKLIQEILAKKKLAYLTTSSTWISAGNIGGISFHSAGGLGLGLDTPERMVAKMSGTKKAQLTRLNVMILEEISMIHPTLLDKFDKAMRILRGVEEPYGGIVMIFIGDFYQLCAVNDNKRDRNTYYAFEAESWLEASPKVCKLTKIMRQEDEVFQNILNAVRTGRIEGVDFDPLYDCMKSEHSRKGEFTVLNTHRRDVSDYNMGVLAKMPGEVKIFKSEDFGPDAMVKNSRLPKELHLKRDALAISLVNEGSLKNGTLVKVLDFEDGGVLVRNLKTERDHLVQRSSQKVYQGRETVEVIAAPNGKWITSDGEEFSNEEVKDGFVNRPKVVASRHNIGLELGWSTTIHKSQGQGFDFLHANVMKCFAPGQLYTALSRATSLEHLTCSDIKSFNVHPKVTKFYEQN